MSVHLRQNKCRLYCSIQTSYNVWIWQPLYATTIGDVELKEWDYEPILIKNEDSDTVEIKLQQVPPEDLCEEILSNATEIDPEVSKT